jgi:DNA-binding MarR family transcriptional regulator
MNHASPQRSEGDGRIMLGLLKALDMDAARSQRDLAAELGIALGLVNAYLKRCIKKGLVKVAAVPRRRYAYYLTPEGFAEKAQLTARYLAYSFSFLRRARAECAELFDRAAEQGLRRFALSGAGEFAEIAILSALGRDVTIVAVIDPAAAAERVSGVPVTSDIAALRDKADAVLVTEITAPEEAVAAAVAAFGSARVFVPPLLGIAPVRRRGVPTS